MKTLLVLEDEPLVMTLLRRMLKEYQVIEALTSEEALRLFSDVDRQVDLLVTDLTMPGMSGIQVALRLRSELPGLPVIVTSGFPVSDWSSRDCGDLEQLGATGVALIQKPFRKQELLQTVCQLIGPAQPETAIAASAAAVG